MNGVQQTQVLYTVDVELSPGGEHWTAGGRRANYLSQILGSTASCGLPYQLKMLNHYELKGVFYIESLFGGVIGDEVLAEIVALVQDAGQEVQLHVHTEWLAYYAQEELDRLGVDTVFENLSSFPRAQQVNILKRAKANLEAAGVKRVASFRAGNFGANEDTLSALTEIGIEFDSSYNVAFAGDRGPCGISVQTVLEEPSRINGVLEVPVSHFDDGWLGYRPLQLCAVSSAEMRHTLLASRQSGRPTACIVSHSFELLNRARTRSNPFYVRRFDELCRFLADHRDILPTVGFNDLELLPEEGDRPTISSRRTLTVARMAEQLAGMVFG